MLSFKEFQTRVVEDASTINAEPELGTPNKGVTKLGVHYSHRQNLHSLAGDAFGSGIKGAEHLRLAMTKDSRIKSRVYFYNRTSDHPRSHAKHLPEGGLGQHVYTAKLHNMYDGEKATDEEYKTVQAHKQKHLERGENPSNAFESAVVDAGYHGYSNGHMSVVLNHRDVPVKYHGLSHVIGRP